MKIVVTGASGFLGKNFLLKTPAHWRVLALYHRSSDFLSFLRRNKLKHVHAISCDLTDEGAVKRAARGREPFEACLYLAANGDPAFSSREPALDLQLNQLALVNFLNNFSVKRLVFFSSGAVYDGLKGPVGPDSRINPALPYAISKWASEQYIRFFKKHGAIKEYVILRFFGTYGPYEAARKIYNKLVRVFCFEKRKEFTVIGNGKNLIDAMYIDDCIRGILKVLRSKRKDLVVDFCCGEPLTINDLVQRAAKTFNLRKIKIIHKGQVPEYIQFRPSPGRMKQFFGFSPKITLEQGLVKFARFLKENENYG